MTLCTKCEKVSAARRGRNFNFFIALMFITVFSTHTINTNMYTCPRQDFNLRIKHWGNSFLWRLYVPPGQASCNRLHSTRTTLQAEKLQQINGAAYQQRGTKQKSPFYLSECRIGLSAELMKNIYSLLSDILIFLYSKMWYNFMEPLIFSWNHNGPNPKYMSAKLNSFPKTNLHFIVIPKRNNS